VNQKRVLDIACGEGYGSNLLLQWGATEVVGVDISREAIAAARHYFSSPGANFLECDVDNAWNDVLDLGPFDVVVSFETIEHVKRPDAFISLLKACCRDGGVTVISAPNDSAYDDGSGTQNEFHLHRFDFHRFRDTTESILGPATEWLRGAPVFGEANYRSDDLLVERAHDHFLDMVSLADVETATLLPSQRDYQPDASTCSHFVGVWGSSLGTSVTVSAQSVARYREPFIALEWQKNHIAALEERLVDQTTELATAKAILEQQSHLTTEVERLTGELARATLRSLELSTANGDLERRLEDLERGSLQAAQQCSELGRANAHLEADRHRLAAELEQTQTEIRDVRGAWERDINSLKGQQASALGALNDRFSAALIRERQRLASVIKETTVTKGSVLSRLSRHLVNRVSSRARREGLLQRDKSLLELSGFFDKNWYIARNPDVVGLDPAEHYLRFGGLEGRCPGPDFDGGRYLRDNPDVAASRQNPLVHYLRFGAAEGRPIHPGSDRIVSPGPTQVVLEADGDRTVVSKSGYFDEAWYRKENTDLAGVSDLLGHFMKHGWKEGRRPGPDFDAGWYLSHYQDIASAGINPLVHYLRHGKEEGRLPGLSTHLLKTATDLAQELASIEPSIAGEHAFDRIDRLPLNQSIVRTKLLDAWTDTVTQLKAAYDYIIFVPWLVRGGAERVAANIANSCAEAHGPGSVLVFVTDYDRRESSDWFLPEVDLVFARGAETDLSAEDRSRMVEMLISAVRPRAVVNVNSRACWDAMLRRGRYLSGLTAVYATLFCRDYAPNGRSAGYVDTHFRETASHLTALFIDSEAFLDELTRDFSLPEAIRRRMHFLPQPVSRGVAARPCLLARSSIRMPVLWSGRFTRQKNVTLLISIIEGAPDIHFDVYGSGEASLQEALAALEGRVDNLTLKGSFGALSELPTEQYAAYLFTSRWEGTPTTLIDIAAMQLPVVASNVGGVSELVGGSTGWLVDDLDSPDPYVEALREIWANPREALRRAECLAGLVQGRHSWSAFSAVLKSTSPLLG
jgi:glycosyltransferase involved in cell wall biosynthesis/SAM-dependent methyltransferase